MKPEIQPPTRKNPTADCGLPFWSVVSEQDILRTLTEELDPQKAAESFVRQVRIGSPVSDMSRLKICKPTATDGWVLSGGSFGMFADCG